MTPTTSPPSTAQHPAVPAEQAGAADHRHGNYVQRVLAAVEVYLRTKSVCSFTSDR
jgi:hypothetical protein